MNTKSKFRLTGKRIYNLANVLIILVMFVSVNPQTVLASSQSTNSAATVTVFATGLNNPRGLKFGPDGYLYVAEGGTGGTRSTTQQQCTQVPDVGPYTGGMTSRISKVSPSGKRTTIVAGLPSSQTNANTGSFVSGVADVAFINGTLYGLEAGAGCSHGLAGTDNTVFRVNPNGTTTPIADLSVFIKANPVAHPNPGDFEPDGTWYSMVAVDGNLYVVEPNHGELDRVALTGKVNRVADISASQGHIVPTSLDYYDDNFYVGNLTTFPLVQGAAKILKISKSGRLSISMTGLTNILGALYDKDGQLYVLESSVGVPFPTPGTGRILRIDDDGNTKVIAEGLSLPTAMTFGPNGNLYVSVNGFGFPAGMGQIVEVHLH